MNSKSAQQQGVNPDPISEVDPLPAEPNPLVKELATQKDLYLRLAADFENYKRRSRQEMETRAAAQKDALLIELLPVVDNLERALNSCTSHDASQIHQGVEMTLRQIRQLLRSHGVESDEILGQPFNPNHHEAISKGHDSTQPDHSVLSILQRSYRRGEKVVRPAKVIVNDLTPVPPRSDREMPA